MATVKISALGPAGLLDYTEIFPIVQSSATKQVALSELWNGTAVGNANYTILPSDVLVYTSVAFTASRGWTLPLASDYGPGRILRTVDAIGTVTPTNYMAIIRQGSDTISLGGVGGGLTQVQLKAAFGTATWISDGVSRWTFLAGFPYGVSTLITEPSNAAAGAGELGEFVDSGSVTGVSLVTGTPKTITSISLTAGDWDVNGWGGINGVAGTTLQLAQAGSNTTTNSLAGASYWRMEVPSFSFGAGRWRFAFPSDRYSIASTTTVYAVVNSIFAGSTMTGEAQIYARRMR